jgi:hypothetical protein
MFKGITSLLVLEVISPDIFEMSKLLAMVPFLSYFFTFPGFHS